MHVGSSSTLPQIAPDAPFMANLTWGASRTSGTMLAWLFSGWFQKYPNLKIALSEGEVGWIPYFLERAEQVLDKQRHWVKKGIQVDFGSAGTHAAAGNVIDLDNFDLRQLYKDHVYGCMIEDKHGIASLDEIGEDNVMCETDYPHSDTTWPDSIHLIKRLIDHLPPETQYKILRGNAEKLYHFTAAEPPVLTGA
jgi:predicted TIM-barrel fold metal-dependent hydrolase